LRKALVTNSVNTANRTSTPKPPAPIVSIVTHGGVARLSGWGGRG
jgi:hypothetical protein